MPPTRRQPFCKKGDEKEENFLTLKKKQDFVYSFSSLFSKELIDNFPRVPFCERGLTCLFKSHQKIFLWKGEGDMLSV